MPAFERSLLFAIVLYGCGGIAGRADPVDGAAADGATGSSKRPVGQSDVSAMTGEGGVGQSDVSAGIGAGDPRRSDASAGTGAVGVGQSVGVASRIPCGSTSCNPATDVCCITQQSIACAAQQTCTGTSLSCGSAADCPSSDVCCETPASNGTLTAACAAICGANDYQLCAADPECPSGAHCVQGLDGFKVCGGSEILCGSANCDTGSEVCCITKSGMACAAKAVCSGTVLACGSAANCRSGQVCCETSANSGDLMAACASSCSSPAYQLCATDSECSSGAHCVQGLNGFKVCMGG
jgi:hypothetical protein